MRERTFDFDPPCALRDRVAFCAGEQGRHQAAPARHHILCSDTISNMKTIAITIDEDMLQRVDRLAGKNRSKAIRQAVREYVTRLEREGQNAREAAIVRRHRSRLARQARALVSEQAKP